MARASAVGMVLVQKLDTNYQPLHISCIRYTFGHLGLHDKCILSCFQVLGLVIQPSLLQIANPRVKRGTEDETDLLRILIEILCLLGGPGGGTSSNKMVNIRGLLRGACRFPGGCVCKHEGPVLRSD